MESQLDEMLKSNGFSRRKNSYIYSRKTNECVQKIEILFFTHPSYCPNALAHIYPYLSVYYPEIGGLAKDVVGESIIISGLKGKTLRQPIQICTDSERWILYDGNEMEIGEKIKAFLEEQGEHKDVRRKNTRDYAAIWVTG